MSPVSQAREYRWRDSCKSSYAARYDDKKWELHEKDIKSLHAKGRTKRQILRVLDTKDGFRPSYGQLRRKLDAWVPKTTHSVETPSQPSSPIQPPPSPPKPCLDGLGQQPPRPETCLTIDEEDMFKKFTSILDDGSETTEPDTTGDGKYTFTHAKGASQSNSQHSQQRRRVPSGSLHTIPSDDDSAPGIPTNPLQTARAAANASTTIAVDSDEDEQPTGSGPLLQSKWSVSPDSREFEELSTQLYRETRKRNRYYSHRDLPPGAHRTVKKTRQRMRYHCCACGEVAHSRACEGCQHKRCSGCQEGTRS